MQDPRETFIEAVTQKSGFSGHYWAEQGRLTDIGDDSDDDAH